MIKFKKSIKTYLLVIVFTAILIALDAMPANFIGDNIQLQSYRSLSAWTNFKDDSFIEKADMVLVLQAVVNTLYGRRGNDSERFPLDRLYDILLTDTEINIDRSPGLQSALRAIHISHIAAIGFRDGRLFKLSPAVDGCIPHEAILVVPYNAGGSERYLQIARKDSPFTSGLIGDETDLIYDDRFMVRDASNGARGPIEDVIDIDDDGDRGSDLPGTPIRARSGALQKNNDALWMQPTNSGESMKDELKAISARKLYVLGLNSYSLSMSDYAELSSDSLDAIVELTASGKKVVFFTNDHYSKIKGLVERSIQRYIDKKRMAKNEERISLSTFIDCYLYTNHGRRKFVLNPISGKYYELSRYRETFDEAEVEKIRRVIDNVAVVKRETVEYTRRDGFREVFDIYGLADTERTMVLRRAKALERDGASMGILNRAISEVIKNPRLMTNLTESPSIFFMPYGLVDNEYYYNADPDFSMRKSVINKLRRSLSDSDINASVDMAGGRGIGIGRYDKRRVLEDAQQAFGYSAEDSVVVADFSAIEDSKLSLAHNPSVAIINTGKAISVVPNPLLQLKNSGGNAGGVFWISMVNEVCSSPDGVKTSAFIGRVINVFEQLIDHPDMPSQRLAEITGITRDQLIEVYGYIRRSNALRMALILSSKYRSFTSGLSELLSDQPRLRKIVAGQIVYPAIVEIHLGTICNSDCIMCFSKGVNYAQYSANNKRMELERRISKAEKLLPFKTGRNKARLESRIESLKLRQNQLPQYRHPLTLGEIKKLLEDCRKNGVQEIWFSGGKEPLMAGRKAIEAIREANAMGFKTRLYTNGELLDKHDAMEVLLGCEQVRISINAATAKTYDRIHFPINSVYRKRRGQRVFDKVTSNVRQFVQLRNQRLNDPSCSVKPRVKIAVSQIIQPLNCRELKRFYQMAYDMGVDSVQVRAESVGSVRPFSDIEKTVIMAQDQGLRRWKALGMFPGLKFESRGLSREELDASKDSAQFLPTMSKAPTCMAGAWKRSVDPFGEVGYCEFSIHPQNARDPRYHSNIGELGRESFGEIMGRMAGSFRPNDCPRCQAHEYGMNIALEKLFNDYKWGIDLDQQPFYQESDSPGDRDKPILDGDVAVIGVGRWGRDVVIPVLSDLLPYKAHIVGVARSKINEARERFADEERVRIVESKNIQHDVLDNKRVKIVVVTSPFDLHYEMAKKALLAGKDVFVEKPFTRTSEEARELLAIAESRGLILAVGYEYLYEPDFTRLGSLIRSEKESPAALGAVNEVNLKMNNIVGGRKLDYSSNVIEDLVGHQISMLMACFGIQKVSGLTCRLKGDGAVIHMIYGGIKVTISVDRDAKREKHERLIEIIGDRGRVILDYSPGVKPVEPDRRPVEYRVYDKNGSVINIDDNRFPSLLRETSAKKFLASEYEAFFEAVRTRVPPFNGAISIKFIGDILDRLNAMAISNLTAEEAGSYVQTHHWDFLNVLNCLWNGRMNSSGRSGAFNYDFEGIKRKPIGVFNVTLIPGRAVRRQAGQTPTTQVKEDFDRDKFNFNKIPSDSKERLVKLIFKCGSMDIVVNCNPFAQDHFIAVPDSGSNRPQHLTRKDLKMAMELHSMAISGHGRMKLIYNSRGASSSVNHIHFQGFSYGNGGEESFMPIERAKSEAFYRRGSLTVSRLVDHPVKGVVFESNNSNVLSGAAMEYVRILQDKNMPHNLLITQNKIYVIPREFSTSHIVDGISAPSAFEMAGELILLDEKSYEKINKEKIARVMSAVMVGPEFLEAAIQAWISEHEKHRSPGEPKDEVDGLRDEPIEVEQVTQLYEIVHETLNSNRADIVEAANALAASLRDAELVDARMTSSEIKSTAARLITRAWQGSDKGAASAADTLGMRLEQLDADSIVANCIVLAKNSKKKGEKSYIGMSADWIPGYNKNEEHNSILHNAMNPLMEKIRSIPEQLRSMGLEDNLELVITETSDELAADILTKVAEGSIKKSNAVIIASRGAVDKRKFGLLQKTETEDGSFVAGIDPRELLRKIREFEWSSSNTKNQIDVDVLELLSLTLEIASGKVPPKTSLVVSYNRKTRVLILMPGAAKLDCTKLLDINNGRKRALQAA